MWERVFDRNFKINETSNVESDHCLIDFWIHKFDKSIFWLKILSSDQNHVPVF